MNPALAQEITRLTKVIKNGKEYQYYRRFTSDGHYIKECTRKPAKESYKNEALRRANFQCEICTARDRKLYVHHKDGLGEDKTKAPNNDRGNLLVVCAICHVRLHKGGVFPDPKAIYHLRSQGHTLQQIGEVFGVSRQRIHQLLGSEVERLKKKATAAKP